MFISKFPLATSQALSVSSATPTAGGNSGSVTLQIFGTGFHAGATAQLNCSSIVAGANLTVGPGGRFLNTTFNLTGVSPGTCDVVVTNLGSSSVTLSQAFTVQQGGTPNLRVYLTGVEVRKVPGEVLLGPADTVVFATVSNIGSVDSTGILVSEPVPVPFSLTSVSPAGVTNLAALTAGSEAVWTGPLAAGTSRVFTSTATTVSSSIADSLIVSAHVIDQNDLTGYATCLAQGGVLMIPSCPLDSTKIQLACVGASTNCADGFPSCVADIQACQSALTGCNLRAAALLEAKCVVENCNGQGSCIGSSPVPEHAPSDPNSLFGPSGVGAQRWIGGGQALTYVTSFENMPTAAVPAQQVVVTQPLGANLALSSLSLLNVTIPNGSRSIPLAIAPGSFNPAANVNEFVTNVDLRPTQSLLVNVDSKLNPSTQTLTWTFTSIDPTTGMPPLNPLIGFLPPGAGANVSFSVKPTPGLPTGTQVTQQATIVFQGASPMSTSAWTNTIDNTPPVSHVSALSAASTCPAFRVGWSGSDVGSGLQGFTIYVSDTGAPYTPWLSNTTAASADYLGAAGHSYSFYSIATDLAGNMEGSKASTEASTSVSASGPCGAPSLSGQLSNVVHSGTTVTATLTVTNMGFTAAQVVNINQMMFRTLSGSGTVTLASPVLPAAKGPLGIGASITVPITLNVPTTVTRFSVTEAGNMQDGVGNNYNYSMAQTVIP